MPNYSGNPEYQLMQIFLGKSEEKVQVFEVYIHNEDETLHCTCPGYRLRHTCKHALWVEQQVTLAEGHYFAAVMTGAGLTKAIRNDPVAFRQWLYDNGSVLMLE